MSVNVEMSPFAKTIMEQKYSHRKKDGTLETWEDISKRVTKHVMGSVNTDKELKKRIQKIITERKFIPGGRYLYASGRKYHQTQNCFLFKAEDSREGWADLLHKSTMTLMLGGGVGVDYSDIREEGSLITRTGGTATGPIALMQMLNECGRGIMQGGSRRSAIWAGLSWWHPDIHKFIQLKNWKKEVRELKSKDFNFPATMDMTNISVLLDDDFFDAYNNKKHLQHAHAHSVYWATVERMLKTGEPGFSIDCGPNKGETLRNACVHPDTEILTRQGYVKISDRENIPTEIWNGFEWSIVIPKVTGYEQEMLTIRVDSGESLTCTKNHKFHLSMDYKGGVKVVDAIGLKPGDNIIKCIYPILESGTDYPYAYTQGFYSGDGIYSENWFNVYENKFCCIDRLSPKQIGNYEKDKYKNEGRKKLSFDFGFMAKDFVPLSWNLRSRIDWLSGFLDADGTEIKEGGAQIVSTNLQFLLGVQKLLKTLGQRAYVSKSKEEGYYLLPDSTGSEKEYFCKTQYRMCIGSVQIQNLKDMGLVCERLSFDNSPQRDASRFSKVVSIEDGGFCEKVYCFNEPKNHTAIFNGIITGQCTEVSSRDDSDVCNLGSINISLINNEEEMAEVVELATAFLLAGTVYSDVPTEKIKEVRDRNRRLGLGLMGLHEWLLKNNKPYGPNDELEKYLKIYAKSDTYAKKYARKWKISVPVKTRAIAPTGTIGILAETTTGIEPIFCVAYKRRYLKHTTWHYQYVIEPTAKRLIEKNNINPDSIEDAYDLAADVERRVQFQAWVQQYVDHGISSTINLPSWGSELNNSDKIMDFGNMIIKYLPDLRGLTVFPDGSRGGQPLTPIKYQTAIKHLGEVFVEHVDVCDITKGGSCGE